MAVADLDMPVQMMLPHARPPSLGFLAWPLGRRAWPGSPGPRSAGTRDRRGDAHPVPSLTPGSALPRAPPRPNRAPAISCQTTMPQAGTGRIRARSRPPGAAMTDCDARGEREPPFGTPQAIIVRLVADSQNRLFWRVGSTGRSRCTSPGGLRRVDGPAGGDLFHR